MRLEPVLSALQAEHSNQSATVPRVTTLQIMAASLSNIKIIKLRLGDRRDLWVVWQGSPRRPSFIIELSIGLVSRYTQKLLWLCSSHHPFPHPRWLREWIDYFGIHKWYLCVEVAYQSMHASLTCNSWMSSDRLSLNSAKTQLIWFGTPQ